MPAGFWYNTGTKGESQISKGESLMKKLFALLIAAVMLLGVAAALADGYEIALVTDVGNIDDHSFNQAAWEGVKAYAEENGKTYAYYRPSEDSTQARVEQIKAAVEKGAKIIVLPGYLFEEAVTQMQFEFPDVIFIALDTSPTAGDGSPAPNTYSIVYKEEQAGYFAGYAIVKDGYTKLGFLGGMAVPAVIRYGYGFVQGAEAAATEMGITVEMKYWYCDSFAPSDSIKTKMDSWYADGTEVVFSCGGGIYLSALAAADAAGGTVIGVDVDQSYESDLIITSAMKGLKASVILSLGKIYDNGGALPEDMAGAVASLGAAEDAAGLPTDEHAWRFDEFTVEEYETVFNAVKDGTIEISAAIDAAPAVKSVNVDYQN